MKTEDLLSKLGSKASAEGSAKAEPSQNSTQSASSASTKPNGASNRGVDMLGAAANKSDSAATGQTNTESEETNIASASKVEPSGSNNATSDDWTLENALKEIKKLREENKTTRVKYSEAVDRLKTESETRITAKEQELQELVKAKDELEQIKAKEEDRKRDLSEKLTHRETLVTELKTKLDTEKKLAEDKIRQYQAELERYKAEAEAQLEVYKQRLNGEMEKIPEKFKDIASALIKGAGDPRDALVLLNEAQLRGVFDDKTVVVSHSVPGAADGARSSKERLDSAVQAAREKMSSTDKIREGLKQVRTGEGNSAFRIR